MKVDQYESQSTLSYAAKNTERFWDNLFDNTRLGNNILKPMVAVVLIIGFILAIAPFYSPVFVFYFIRRKFRQRKMFRFTLPW